MVVFYDFPAAFLLHMSVVVAAGFGQRIQAREAPMHDAARPAASPR